MLPTFGQCVGRDEDVVRTIVIAVIPAACALAEGGTRDALSSRNTVDGESSVAGALPRQVPSFLGMGTGGERQGLQRKRVTPKQHALGGSSPAYESLFDEAAKQTWQHGATAWQVRQLGIPS